jgi:hypothetical protein
MNYFAPLLLLSLALSAPATAADDSLPEKPATVRHESSRQFSKGADRTITWRAWKEVPGGEFRVRTGDRYLGGQQWEHYLGFEQYPASGKAIKLSLFYLASEYVDEVVVLRPGSRYAIVKVTNGSMTARKGVWTWTAQEVKDEKKTGLRSWPS